MRRTGRRTESDRHAEPAGQLFCWLAAAQFLRGGARDVTATTQCLRGALSRPAGSAGWSCGLRPISQALRGAGAESLSPRRACEVGAWRRRRPAASVQGAGGAIEVPRRVCNMVLNLRSVSQGCQRVPRPAAPLARARRHVRSVPHQERGEVILKRFRVLYACIRARCICATRDYPTKIFTALESNQFTFESN